jgi:hypothetical protein
MAVESELSRREALKVGGIIGTGALGILVSSCAGASAAAAPSAAGAPAGLPGAWLEDITLGDGSKHQTISLYTKDGGVASIPSLPASSFSVAFGAWIQNSDGYLQTMELFQFDSSGAVSGILRIRAQIAVDQGGDHMTGRALLDMQAVGDTKFVSVGTATLTGGRIKPLGL